MPALAVMKLSLLTITWFPIAISALKFPVRQTKRDSFGVATANPGSSTGIGEITLADNQDRMYIANVTINGVEYPVQIDTGSSDLWVRTGSEVPNNQYNLYQNITYGTGYAYGPIDVAPVSFSGFEIPSQAYMIAEQADNPIFSNGAVGILGTSFNSLSSIDSAVSQAGGAWGRSLLYNIFSQNTSERNFMAYSLQRQDDPNHDVQGFFTIGEYVEEYAAIASTTPIPTFPEQNPTQWTILVDSIVVNGQEVSLASKVDGAPSTKAVALLDTGTSDVLAPTEIVTSIYGSVPGASFSDGQWYLPCDAEVDVTIIIGGREFDIHPLDTVKPTGTDLQTCTGSWQPSLASLAQSPYDFIFGDAALRSMYAVFDYGDFDANNNIGDPYVQLLSLVNGSDASAEFNEARGGTGNNPTLSNSGIDDAAAATPNSLDAASTSNPSSDVNDLKSKVNNIMKWVPVAIGLAAANVLVLLVLLIVGIVACVRRRKSSRTAPSGSFLPGGRGYRPIFLDVENADRSHGYEKPKYGEGVQYSD